MPYPIIVNLEHRRCVVIGAGRVAERRIDALLRQGAIVRLVAPQATPMLRTLAETGKLTWMRALYTPAHLEDAFLVIAATDEREINAIVTRDAQERNLLVLCADASGEGNFITPAVIERGDLLIALSTGGKSPTFAAAAKARIEAEFGPEWGAWTELFGRLRGLIQQMPSESLRREAVESILGDSSVTELVRSGDIVVAAKEAERCILSQPV